VSSAVTEKFQSNLPSKSARPSPGLQNGDRLSKAEFLRRYEAEKNVNKAELIGGIVYMGSPVSLDAHAVPHGRLIGWLTIYSFATSVVAILDNLTIDFGLGEVYQPDAVLCLLAEYGGRLHRGERSVAQGAPELVAEVANSSASLDMNDKYRVYRDSGVEEYLVWRVAEEAIDWFVLDDGEYRPLSPDADGVLRSRRFPGLWLDPAALLADDRARIKAVAEEGLRSEEYAAFVKGLDGVKTA